MNHRNRRRRRKPYRNTNIKNSAFSVVLVICVSVAAGYLTATYILGPILGLESEPSFFQSMKNTEDSIDEKPDEKTIVEDEVGSEQKSGFALQYGSFSDKKGAEELVLELKSSGIETEIIEKDGMYKVIGELFETKEQARSTMNEASSGQDVFITQIP